MMYQETEITCKCSFIVTNRKSKSIIQLYVKKIVLKSYKKLDDERSRYNS